MSIPPVIHQFINQYTGPQDLERISPDFRAALFSAAQDMAQGKNPGNAPTILHDLITPPAPLGIPSRELNNLDSYSPLILRLLTSSTQPDQLRGDALLRRFAGYTRGAEIAAQAISQGSHIAQDAVDYHRFPLNLWDALVNQIKHSDPQTARYVHCVQALARFPPASLKDRFVGLLRDSLSDVASEVWATRGPDQYSAGRLILRADDKIWQPTQRLFAEHDITLEVLADYYRSDPSFKGFVSSSVRNTYSGEMASQILEQARTMRTARE